MVAQAAVAKSTGVSCKDHIKTFHCIYIYKWLTNYITIFAWPQRPLMFEQA